VVPAQNALASSTPSGSEMAGNMTVTMRRSRM
jgi:hypothetical protein